MNKSKKIIDLNNVEAKSFFRLTKNYVNFELPYYFNFDNLLTMASAIILTKDIKEICKKDKSGKTIDFPKNYENVNYTLLCNKDGLFAWRPLQLINPILYVDLVKLITEKENWKKIQSRFKDFKKGVVECISIPRVSEDVKKSHKAAQVSHWWEEIEQRSIKLSLDYNYVFITDITNCYGSIYTHSVEWALSKGGKKDIKFLRSRKSNTKESLGAKIDMKLRNMNYGQTNGIPQGSTLMDFIAEIVLGYADLELSRLLKKFKAEFHILRYRDDYRIFVNNPVHGQHIMKELNTVLCGLGMKMNASKTLESADVILSSIKSEKLEKILVSPSIQHFQKEALRIYQLSKKYPNSGLVVRELSDFYDKINSKLFIKSLKEINVEVLITIFTQIALFSPKVIDWVSAIISNLVELVNKKTEKQIITKIHRKFKNIPNTGLIDIWLQRITAPRNIKIKYSDNLTKIAVGRIINSKIWEFSWLDKGTVDVLNLVSISTLNQQVKEGALSRTIDRKEVELFKLRTHSI
ncbi:MAG: RNA-directed DNA polymerase [Patescibacteria group bacterium]